MDKKKAKKDSLSAVVREELRVPADYKGWRKFIRHWLHIGSMRYVRINKD